jgi:hypothetical protein
VQPNWAVSRGVSVTTRNPTGNDVLQWYRHRVNSSWTKRLPQCPDSEARVLVVVTLCHAAVGVFCTSGSYSGNSKFEPVKFTWFSSLSPGNAGMTPFQGCGCLLPFFFLVRHSKSVINSQLRIRMYVTYIQNVRNFVCFLYTYFKSRDSSVGIATGYGLDDRGSRFRFPAGAGNFSLHWRVQTGSGAHPTSYPMGTGGCLPGG